MASSLERKVEQLERAVARMKGHDPRSPVARMLSDVASKQTQTDQKVTRILAQPAQERVEQASSGIFTYVDPHQEVFTDTGSGANSLGAAQTLDFGPYVSSSAIVAYCVLTMEADRSGGDASDSEMYAEWLPDGGTDWLPLGEHFPSHELVDDAQFLDKRHCIVPLGASRSGQIRVYEALDTWTYTLDLFAYQ